MFHKNCRRSGPQCSKEFVNIGTKAKFYRWSNLWYFRHSSDSISLKVFGLESCCIKKAWPIVKSITRSRYLPWKCWVWSDATIAKRSCLPSFLSTFVCLRLDMVGVIHCRSQELPHSTLTEARQTCRGPLSSPRHDCCRQAAAARVTRRGPSHSPRPAVTRSGLLLLT